MKAKKILFIAFAMIPALCNGRPAGAADSIKVERLDSVVVSALRAGSRTPVAFTTVTQEIGRASCRERV